MIARIRHGKTSVENVEEYLDYLNKTGIPDYRKTAGNLAAYVLLNIEGETAHFLTLSFWDPLDSIKLFAGEDYRKARYLSRRREIPLRNGIRCTAL